MEEDKKFVPFIPLRGQTFFPDTLIGFEIGRDKSLKSLEVAMNGDKYIVAAAQRDISVNDPKQEDCYMTGVLLKLKQAVKRQEDYVRVMASCEKRVRIEKMINADDMFLCTYRDAEDLYPDAGEDMDLEALVRVLRTTYFRYVEMTDSGEAEAHALIDDVDNPALLANIIAGEIEVTYDVKQTVLEIDYVPERIEELIEIINHENQVLALVKRINNKVMQNMNQGQKDYYLREQLKVIREELGEDETGDEEADAWLEKLDRLKLPEKTDAKVRKEIDRFRKMGAMSPDANVSRTYIETILELPWHKESKTNINIRRAEKILNEDHYGLEKVKERILEYLAVMHLTKSIKGPILCLVGPPGVGKTSIARSIARATNREFVRMSLGGVRDEAEIRGHRRTYVGAIPGRVINGIIESGTNNPLFLFDEAIRN